MTNPDDASPRPSATVVMLRPDAAGFSVLLMRRHARIDVHGDAWVFPGGRVQADDVGPGTEIDVARRAAVREVAEEVGIGLDPHRLIPLSHWTTPVGIPKRFATWFFLAEVDPDAVPLIDGVEAVAADWFTPAAALALGEPGSHRLAPPQVVTLLWLQQFEDISSVIRAVRVGHPVWFTPRLVSGREGGTVTLYEGDVAYDDPGGDLDRAGPRNRLRVHDGRWYYERSD